MDAGPWRVGTHLQDTELGQIRQERDLYRRLLTLGDQTDLEPFLKEALELVVEVSGAALGYLEVRDLEAEEAWSLAHGFSSEQVEDVRAAISQGIIGEALATGTTILTHAALLDERFQARESVRAGQIEAVLCAPIGRDAALGVVYLQGRSHGGMFSPEDRDHAETLARHLAPLADRLVVRRRATADATRELRARYRLEGIVGHSAALARAVEQAMLAAPLDVNVLLTGDSGTGKSQLARTVHENSPRHNGPFVELNCSTLPEKLFESELFGAMKGSHSQAHANTEGKVAAAENGTLFLDEIGEVPREAQAKLLQLLQSKRYYPLGSNRPIEANIRLVAATNTDLEAAVSEKRFREDLFYRLNVLPVRLPSLAERREDLLPLSRALITRACERHGLAILELSPAACQALTHADWPGNIRQLENTLEAATIRAHGQAARELGARHLFPEQVESSGAGENGDSETTGMTFQEATRRFQQDLLAQTLEDTDWNVSETARRLDLARSHVYNLIKAFGLTR
ncbi:MAG: sigma-54-dependent Fis family transcriptional regulator [Deltaproteobacteria bacterium]|nr:sigma-54-dependent Fis family transcriptional regulator [Deltaproteobacteria bacterium]MBW2395531.1 sigma-54-dependent Fis family transcriptional regulator [Deltaproteobacteria bacterium]